MSFGCGVNPAISKIGVPSRKQTLDFEKGALLINTEELEPDNQIGNRNEGNLPACKNLIYKKILEISVFLPT